MRWLTGVLIALTVYVLAYVVKRPTLGQPEPTLDFWDECAAGPADDDLLTRRAP